jgi:hypothetical protein
LIENSAGYGGQGNNEDAGDNDGTDCLKNSSHVFVLLLENLKRDAELNRAAPLSVGLAVALPFRSH